jgi:hypothetical protein
MRLILASLGFSAVSMAAQADAGAVFSGDGLRSFFFAVGNYYNVPERDVAVIHDRAISPDDIPVVFYVAQRAHVAPAVVVDLRRSGSSWADVAFHLRLDPGIYYFSGGPPYGKSYGYWKKHPPQDEEVIDAVNVHFLADYHRVSPDVVWTERSRGRSYVVVAHDFDAKSHGKGHEKDFDDDDRGHGDGHGKGKDNGHGR